MKKNIKRAIAVLLSLVIILVVGLGAVIMVAAVTDYKPQDETLLEYEVGEDNMTIETDKEYSIVTYNIGYAALGKDQDFFMDGGTGKGAKTKDEVENNIAAITDYIHGLLPDFVFLQEVDIKAKRSFGINELDRFLDGNYSSVFGMNYKVKYVPVPIPIFNAMGGVESGIVTLSKSHPTSAMRYNFDGKEMYLQQLFDLDRCFTITRFDTENDRELVLINAHFSAFDKGGTVREQQLKQMQKILLDEQSKGNYVILGGDFNHELPGTSSSNFTWKGEYPEWCMILPDDFAPDGYGWANDSKSPTCRAVDKMYVEGENFLAVLDGFLISDNVGIVSVKNRGDFDFENSDHNPVEFVFKLKN